MKIKEFLERIIITNANEAATLANKDTFIINLCEPAENRFADVFMPLVFQFNTTEQISIPEARLTALGHIISYGLDNYRRVIIHCTAGMERSPLAVAYYIAKRWRVSIPCAYDILKKRYPNIMDRAEWIRYATLRDYLANMTTSDGVCG